MRIILYTGKGGVGKTSIAAATACRIAEQGKKVLVLSTDQAHSLGDSFNTKLNNEPKEIAQNLYAMEIDTVLENEKVWGDLKGYINKLMILKSQESIETEELLVFPGFEELLSLIKVKEFHDEGEFDVLIVDCAPTGETMSLLKFPELFKVWMEKIFPIKRKSAKLLGKPIESILKIPMPEEAVFDDIELLYSKIDELRSIMLDKNKVSIRIVTTPESIVIKEAKRSFSYLHLFDYNVDGIIINKIFPKESIKGYFQKWEEIQNDSIRDIEESFREIPIFKLDLMNNELKEYDMLNNVGGRLYGDLNPEDILFNGKIFEVKNIDNEYIFSIVMPFVNKEELNLVQKDNELIITVKNEKRKIQLPPKLLGKEVVGAKYEYDRLNIRFQ